MEARDRLADLCAVSPARSRRAATARGARQARK